jgi:hypothetical protein
MNRGHRWSDRVWFHTVGGTPSVGISLDQSFFFLLLAADVALMLASYSGWTTGILACNSAIRVWLDG